MRRLFILLLIACSFVSTAQDTDVLLDYLKRAAYPVDLNSREPLPTLPHLMQGNNVLIVGESVSHGLELYDTLQAAVTRQLSAHGLKRILIEYGRTYAAAWNAYLDGESWANFLNPLPVSHRGWEFISKAAFQIRGIDFERGWTFYLANNALLKNADTAVMTETSRSIIRRVLDTNAYLNTSYKGFQSWYKQLSRDFTANQFALQKDLGNQYERLHYYCTNPNVTRPGTNRNKALAANFLSEVLPLDTTALYYCEIGANHSMPRYKNFMVTHILKHPELQNRVRILFVYCDDCVSEIGQHGSSIIKGLKGDLLTCFRNATKGNATLFDLSGLPNDFRKLRGSGDLLLFIQSSQ